MNILILGATGRTGKYTLSQALERGHIVNVLVRDPAKITPHHQLNIFRGTPTDKIALSTAMTGCEAVLSTLNISRNNDFPWSSLRTPKDFLTDTIRNVIELAAESSIKRIVVCSAWGVAETRSELPGWFRWMIDNSNIGPAYQQHEQVEKILAATEFDWTVVRPAALTNSPKLKPLKISVPGQPTGHSYFVSRQNVARFMLNALENNLYVRELPTISE